MNLQVEKIRLLLIGQIALSQREMSEAGVQLVGLAGAAKDGLRLVQRLKPDLVVIAVNMPEPADLVAIEEVMKIQPTPILLVAERCEERLAQDAVRRGALEVMATANDSGGRRQLLHKIRLLAGVKVIRHIIFERQTGNGNLRLQWAGTIWLRQSDRANRLGDRDHQSD